jgi:putative membrane protein
MAQGTRKNNQCETSFSPAPCTLDRVPSAGLPGEDYEAKGAVQMALDELDCGLEEHPRGAPAAVELFTLFMTQDTSKRRSMTMGILLRWLVLTAAIMVASYVVEGITVKGFWSAFFSAAILGILNAFFRPILIFLTLPLTILSFGLFIFVINALLLMMVSGVIPGFEVHGFWSAVFGSLIISIVSWLLGSFVNERGKIQYIDLKKRGRDMWG